MYTLVPTYLFSLFYIGIANIELSEFKSLEIALSYEYNCC